jgi:flagellar motility protein MotE (MotC chaperone)
MKIKEDRLRRVKQMVSVISNMKPAKAAEILSVQDAQVSLKILEQIDPPGCRRSLT